MLMFPVKPVWTINLDHPATRVASSADATRIAIAAEGPLISVTGIGQDSIRRIKLTEPAGHLAIGLEGELLAVVNASHTLQVLSLQPDSFGNEVARRNEPVHSVCEFSRDGTALWSVALVANDIADIRCYDIRTFELIANHRFKLPIGQCGFVLTVHPREDVVALWACGRPDEVWNYWIRLTSAGIEVEHQPELDGSTPPCFNSRGDRFVILNGYDLVAFSFPNCKMLYEPVASIDEDNSWSESMVYRDSSGEDRILTSTNESRIFVVELEQGRVAGEVYLEGHEPKPCHQVYSSLKTDDSLCTDLHSFRSATSDLVLSVHTNGKASNRQDTVLCWATP